MRRRWRHLVQGRRRLIARQQSVRGNQRTVQRVRASIIRRTVLLSIQLAQALMGRAAARRSGQEVQSRSSSPPCNRRSRGSPTSISAQKDRRRRLYRQSSSAEYGSDWRESYTSGTSKRSRRRYRRRSDSHPAIRPCRSRTVRPSLDPSPWNSSVGLSGLSLLRCQMVISSRRHLWLSNILTRPSR